MICLNKYTLSGKKGSEKAENTGFQTYGKR